MRLVRDERGVAMLTVLFMAAVLTVVASSATFLAIREFQAASDDQRAAKALAYAEAGLDRFVLEIRGGGWTWGELLLSGCPGQVLRTISGTLGTNGTYTTQIRPRICPDPNNLPIARRSQEMIITSTGIQLQPSARRIVRQVIDLKPKGLPVGLYASSNVGIGGAGGGVRVQQTSLVTGGPILGRDQLEFAGMDPYYTRNDFYPDHFTDPNEVPGSMPASAHAGGFIECQAAQPCGPDKIEHTGDATGDGLSATAPTDRNINCTANNGPNPAIAAWDGSSNGGAVSLPPTGPCSTLTAGQYAPTSLFDAAGFRSRVTPQPTLTDEDRSALKSKAQSSGLYCSYNAAGNGTCTVAGGAPFSAPPSFTTGTLNLAAMPRTWTAYFEFAEGTLAKSNNNTVNWNLEVASCSNNPSLNRSVTMVLSNGSLSVGSSGVVTGAVFAERGVVRTAGGALIHGTVIADELDIRGGSNFLVDDCWLRNMPIAFLDVIPLRWSEVDR